MKYTTSLKNINTNRRKNKRYVDLLLHLKVMGNYCLSKNKMSRHLKRFLIDLCNNNLLVLLILLHKYNLLDAVKAFKDISVKFNLFSVHTYYVDR